MKSVDISLNERELKFLIDLMWGAPIATVKDTAERHGIKDNDLEGYLAKCLGYMYLESDSWTVHPTAMPKYDALYFKSQRQGIMITDDAIDLQLRRTVLKSIEDMDIEMLKRIAYECRCEEMGIYPDSTYLGFNDWVTQWFSPWTTKRIQLRGNLL